MMIEVVEEMPDGILGIEVMVKASDAILEIDEVMMIEAKLEASDGILENDEVMMIEVVGEVHGILGIEVMVKASDVIHLGSDAKVIIGMIAKAINDKEKIKMLLNVFINHFIHIYNGYCAHAINPILKP